MGPTARGVTDVTKEVTAVAVSWLHSATIDLGALLNPFKRLLSSAQLMITVSPPSGTIRKMD